MDAERSRLLALGKLKQEIGQLGVAVLRHQPSDGVAAPPSPDLHIQRAGTAHRCRREGAVAGDGERRLNKALSILSAPRDGEAVR